jgi:hypothetical protein
MKLPIDIRNKILDPLIDDSSAYILWSHFPELKWNIRSKKLDWGFVLLTERVSEEFIREFHDRVDWYLVSSEQTLSEEFIREFQDRIVWDYLYQDLSEDFVLEFQDKFQDIGNVMIENKYYIERPIERPNK